MNRFLVVGCAFTLLVGAAEVAQANKTKCNAQYVAGVLQQASVDKGDLVVPERRYGMAVNKYSVPDHMASPMQAALNDATEETIQATWVPATEGTQEMCLINLTHSNGQTTEVVLYPYSYVEKS